MMPAFQQKQHPTLPQPPPQQISPLESARYTGDLLETLRKMAQVQGQSLLAHLLELAQVEAKLIVREGPPVRSLRPGGN
jgi:hypothetical protein